MRLVATMVRSLRGGDGPRRRIGALAARGRGRSGEESEVTAAFDLPASSMLGRADNGILSLSDEGGTGLRKV